MGITARRFAEVTSAAENEEARENYTGKGNTYSFGYLALLRSRPRPTGRSSSMGETGGTEVAEKNGTESICKRNGFSSPNDRHPLTTCCCCLLNAADETVDSRSVGPSAERILSLPSIGSRKSPATRSRLYQVRDSSKRSRPRFCDLVSVVPLFAFRYCRRE